MPKPVYELTLGKTYYEKGFFNVGVAVEQYIANDDSDMVLFLGDARQRISGTMSRKPNNNNTPRVYGGNQLRDWFMRHYDLLDRVDVVIEAPDTLWIR